MIWMLATHEPLKDYPGTLTRFVHWEWRYFMADPPWLVPWIAECGGLL